MSNTPDGGSDRSDEIDDAKAAKAAPAKRAKPARDEQHALPQLDSRRDRGRIILSGLRSAAAFSWRFLVVVAAVALILYLLGKLWVGVLPLLLALILSTVLAPAVNWLIARKVPAGLAAGGVLLTSILIIVGVFTAVAPSVVSQGQLLGNQAADGVRTIMNWAAGPPLELQNEQVSEYVDRATAWIQEQGSRIASGVVTGVSAVGSLLVALVMTLVLMFFFLKDGSRFLPWLRDFVGSTAGLHLTESLSRVWQTLGGYIRAQAIVALVDAIFIGLGLLVLQVPLAFVLALLTFIGGFIPIVGAVIAGVLAVLVALVSQSFVTAIWVLVLVIAVQQLESNVVAPIVQSRTMELHPALILLAVAAGGTRWGIIGAFLAVPVTAALVSVLRYVGQLLDLRTGTITADQVNCLTPEGRTATALAARSAPQGHGIPEDDPPDHGKPD